MMQQRGESITQPVHASAATLRLARNQPVPWISQYVACMCALYVRWTDDKTVFNNSSTAHECMQFRLQTTNVQW
jgi:hypothetical protein